MQTTLLSTIISTMDTWRDIANIEEQYKVRQLDYAIREVRRNTNFPWNLKKGTLRVFDDVLVYPIASDHDELGYIDKQNIKNYSDSARFYNTSLQQFFEKVNSTRNLMAEIWDSGTKMIGLDYKDFDVASQKLSSAEDPDEYTTSGDASDPVLDNVIFKKGSGSIAFTVTNSTGTATISNTFTTYSDSLYKRKYHFKYIYLD